MKRSEINAILRRSEAFIRAFGYLLPPFAQWSPREMQARRVDIEGIVSARLGWDITDYGQGDFARLGLVLFTARNGRAADLARGGGLCYAEKIMISRENQLSPLHRHIVKTEDIINRGGATLAIEMFSSDAAGALDSTAPVIVASDGVTKCLPAGGSCGLRRGKA